MWRCLSNSLCGQALEEHALSIPDALPLLGKKNSFGNDL